MSADLALGRPAGVGSALHVVESRLEARGARHQGKDWQCPAHDDDNPSLSVSQGEHKVLIHCQAGCRTEDVLVALGLTYKDLFEEGVITTASKLVAPVRAPQTLVVEYSYENESKAVEHQTLRYDPKKFAQRRPDGAGGWKWSLNGARRVLFRLPQVLEAAKAGRRIWIPEGEKDVLNLERAGVTATCNPMGAGCWRDEFAEFLVGAKDVVIVQDKDDPGRAHAAQVAASVRRLGITVKIVEAAEGKDASDHLAAGHSLAEFVPVVDESATEGDDPDALAALVEPARLWSARTGSADQSLVPGVLAASGLGILASEPKAGKTWFAVSLGLSVANRCPLLGYHVVNVQVDARVLMILSEGSHGGTVARTHSLARAMGLDLDQALENIDIIWRRGIQLTDSKILEALAARTYALIIVDVARDTWSGDENKADDVGKLLRGLRPLIDGGATVLLSLHMSKPTEQSNGRRLGNRIRGSSAFYGAADSMIFLERLAAGNDVKVTFESRDDAPAEPMVMTLPVTRVDGTAPVELNYRPAEGTKTNADRIDVAVVAAVTQTPGMSKNALSRCIEGRKTDILDAVDRAVRLGRIFHDHRGYFPADSLQLKVVPETPEPPRNHPEPPVVQTGSPPYIRGTGTTLGTGSQGTAR